MVQVAQETEAVTLRRLPDGVAVRGRMERRGGDPLKVAVSADGIAAEFSVGSAVEIQCDRVLYFGEVVGVLGSAVVMEVKHALDRAALEALQEVWQDKPRVRRSS